MKLKFLTIALAASIALLSVGPVLATPPDRIHPLRDNGPVILLMIAMC